jgi:integrase/recombinase XerD
VALKVEDAYVQDRRLWLRLHEKRGKILELPCHRKLKEFLYTYLEAAGI